ncbi:capsular polysaccharide synthesis protein-domain-containing protein [Astrocystis sublimbata]|nr:capsular polysaccharide synthesis protein-domain-containing protein [Astrocystis sublimbata]
MPPSADNVSASPKPNVTSAAKVTVPPGLTLIDPNKLDLRTDEEIATWIQEPHPVTSDKNVWAFWDKGFVQMPPWVQRNVINWVRRLGSGWTVHLLDKVPGSLTNVANYIESSYFPDAYNNGTIDGPYAGTHSGDLVRLPLLWEYGGVWMDVGTFLFRNLDDICWKQIEDPATPYEMSGFATEVRPGVQCMLNGFIAARRGNPFIQRWMVTYKSLWAGKTNCTDFHKHPLLRHLPVLRPPFDDMNCPGLNITMESFSDYLAAFMCFERVRKLIDPSDGFSGPEYYAQNMLLYDALQETYFFQQQTNWSGTHQFDLLAAKRTGEEVVRDEKWQEAESFVTNALANTSTMKLSHGPVGALDSFLADLWDSPEHQDKDSAENTFAAYLRYGSVHFDQVRELVPMKMGWPTEEVLTCGVLEPKDVEI